MTNTTELNRLIEASSESKEAIASKLGISLGSLNNKIANRTEFKASEIASLRGILNLTKNDVFNLFFSNIVSGYDTEKGVVNG